MKKKTIIGMVIIMGIMSILGSLLGRKETMPLQVTDKHIDEYNLEDDSMEPGGEYIVLQELVSCNEKQAVSIVEEFEKNTNKVFGEAELVPSENKMKILKVTCDAQIYYLKIGTGNMLREIREDSLTGNCIYQIIF